jgi:hypothetical protein
MTLFDLLFIALFLTAAGNLVAAGIAALRGRSGAALRRLRILAIGAVAYLAVVVMVSLLSPRHYIGLGDRQCSDDWCIAAVQAQRAEAANEARYEVTFEVSSRARRAVQRERSVVVYLRDGEGRRYDAEPAGSDPPFDVQLDPGQTVRTTRFFSIPSDVHDVGVVVTREGGMPGPGCCVISDEGSLLHKRTVIRLQS